MTPIRIAGIELVTFELERAVAFYVEALGFTAAEVVEDGEDLLAHLKFGEATLHLRCPADPRASYPQPRAANDPWFQHFAIAVSSAAEACDRVLKAGGLPISEGAPLQLPPSSGSVTAWKFRDPDGHPLELSEYPSQHRSSARTHDRLFLALDHTAIAVSDLERSVAFYTGLGFRERSRGLNHGPSQARLDGLQDPVVDIVVLEGSAEPHLELLHYQRPLPAPARAVEDDDIAATRTRIGGLSHAIRDPDGHRLEPLAS